MTDINKLKLETRRRHNEPPSDGTPAARSSADPSPQAVPRRSSRARDQEADARAGRVGRSLRAPVAPISSPALIGGRDRVNRSYHEAAHAVVGRACGATSSRLVSMRTTTAPAGSACQALAHTRRATSVIISASPSPATSVTVSKLGTAWTFAMCWSGRRAEQPNAAPAWTGATGSGWLRVYTGSMTGLRLNVCSTTSSRRRYETSSASSSTSSTAGSSWPSGFSSRGPWTSGDGGSHERRPRRR